VAESLLEGTIALKEKRNDAAVDLFRIAVETEENMVYNEPRDWFLNPKHYLGDAYIKTGRWKDAESTFTKDLLNNNENGWALFGLYQALMGQGKKSGAEQVMARYKKAFRNADIKLVNAVY
jgi:tetratricopeptide (TPR) repeat protein